MNKFQQTTLPVEQPPSYSDRQFLHTTNAGVKVPFLQAFITACLMSLFTAAVIYIFDGLDYFKPMAGMFVFTLVGMWVFLQRRWLWLTKLEEFLKMDLTGDNVVGEPKQIRIQVDEVKSNGHLGQSQLFTLPCDENELSLIAQKIRMGVPFSEKEWTGAGKLFSVARFREIRSEMLKRQMLVPASSKSGKQGFVFTRAGQAVLDHYAPPPPQE